MTQIQQAQNLLKSLKEDIKVEEERLAVAQNQCKSLEKRNKVVLDAITAAGDTKKKLLIEQAEGYQRSIDEEIKKGEAVEQHLLKDIERLSNRKTSLDKSVDDTIEAKNNLDKQLIDDNEKHQELVDRIVAQLSEIKVNEGKINDSRTQVRELERIKHDIESDIDILRETADSKHGEILELDEQFTSQKKILDERLYETERKLEKTVNALAETDRKDKQFRATWSEERIKLEKRTEAVRRMEARVSDAESRIEELNKYDIL